MARNVANRIRMHRFHEFVAFDISAEQEDTGTIYLTEEMAECFADRLREYAEDIRGCKFTLSQLGNKSITQE